ncbi:MULTISPECIES: sensor histidine kinase [Rhizobium]|uniref:Signal transduction histidine-protein kinase/phosphatase MprB n=1 Tax=Rhizobium tropici TaxID=398 RepID=A0A6P1CA71_RHITR|nr:MULTISPECIES: HAMP domain-containing sensor histidine kinase [Rhizobium]AGB75156.1 two-component sensor histidine kinase [Rhizobium tropici CIAT 899]MBB4242896.1 signal transduction histidine kinase [Rhizobium tropici]MBB5594689.1 signal transduction histidine kinase [Rhizobium tropici]MBB6493221.1 signal transduction histidine kinase [Rhizobium tropici]NEV14018.1 HAMP domain-containing histidine kinase [Rhizobium tropici]
MRTPRVKSKWRPPLALIVYSVLLTVMMLPMLTIIWFRVVRAASGAMAPAELATLAAVLILTLIVAYVLTRTLTTPINALIARTEEIARGGRSAIRPLEIYGTREVATLSQSFLDLAGKLVDHSDYVRSFATHVSHELKSPLTSIRGAAELLRDDVDNPMSREQRNRFLTNIIADTERLDRLLSRLRELAKAELPSEQGSSSLRDVIAQLETQFRQLAIIDESSADEMLALPGEAASIIFANLAENAFQNGATGLAIKASGEGRGITIQIRDNGCGIANGNRDRIFEPFFSTRRDDGGTGMGLGIVRAMLASHGGSIELLESSKDGTAFQIILPIAA